MKYSNLVKYLPANSIDPGTTPQRIKLDLNNLTASNLTMDSSIIRGLARYLQAVYDYSEAINKDRESKNLLPINLIHKDIKKSEKGNPIYEYTISVEVNSSTTFDGAIDPAAEA